MGKRRLVDLHPLWVGVDTDPDGSDGVYAEGVEAGVARGLSFLCPSCENVRTSLRIPGHRITIWWKPPTWMGKKTPTWKMTGASFAELTLHPSVNAVPSGYCLFHGWVKSGEVSW
jgi:hypothetical protein